MPRFALYIVFTILVAVSLSPAAQAQPVNTNPGTSFLQPVGPFLVTFNENGQATISVNGGPATVLTGSLMVDPTAPVGSGAQALTYSLPEPVVSGTVSFTQPGGGVSDWLRFTNATGILDGSSTGTTSRMILYSDIETGEPPVIADVGPPPVHSPDNSLACGVNPFCAGETGSEAGPNGFDYRPGGVPAFANNEYVGLSDPAPSMVPEPASLVLLGSGLAAMGLFGRRRRQG